MYFVNREKVIDISRLSDESKPICGKCMKGKETKNLHKIG